jgi:hypothetical protein
MAGRICEVNVRGDSQPAVVTPLSGGISEVPPWSFMVVAADERRSVVVTVSDSEESALGILDSRVLTWSVNSCSPFLGFAS